MKKTYIIPATVEVKINTTTPLLLRVSSMPDDAEMNDILEFEMTIDENTNTGTHLAPRVFDNQW